MENQRKNEMLESIGLIYERAEKCGLKELFFQQCSKELGVVASYLDVTEEQAFLASVIFALHFKGDCVDLNSLIEYFECNPMKILTYYEDIKKLLNMQLLVRTSSYHPFAPIESSIATDSYVINNAVQEAILTNGKMPVLRKKQFSDVIELFEEICKVGKMKNEGQIDKQTMTSQTKALLDSNKRFPLVKKILAFQFCPADTFLFVYIIWNQLKGFQTELDYAVKYICDTDSESMRYVQRVMNGDNHLIAAGLLDIEEAGFMTEACLKLSDISVRIIQESGIHLFVKRGERGNVLNSDGIKKKTLFFDEREVTQIRMLEKLLDEKVFIKTGKRLEKKGLPGGITVLMHGSPGTGKTETVLQLAKKTGRDIIKVDMSQTKSMWFGESEKIVKNIFKEYRMLLNSSEKVPILFFNEADAIISKRQSVGKSSCSQTENAIQNILLEELENFEGIFVATTNLVKNLDLAFERRFLFKVEFFQPSVQTKTKIWRSRLSFLKNEQCIILSEKYDFSGAQIENVKRKCEIEEVISGIKVGFDKIIEFCNQERLYKKEMHKEAGFRLAVSKP
jgi:hypothetical protein